MHGQTTSTKQIPLKVIFSESLSSLIQAITPVILIVIRCYGQALSLSPESPSLWHDLGMMYLCRAKEAQESSQKQMFYSRALNSLKKAVLINPKSHLLWNSLGVAATKAGSFRCFLWWFILYMLWFLDGIHL